MKQLRAISFPRSGVSIFCVVFEMYYAEKKKNKKAYFCNSVGCCSHKMPCKKSETMDLDFLYMKNHDFNSRVPNTEDSDVLYVVLYRKEVQEQVCAYFRYSNDGRQQSDYKKRAQNYHTSKNKAKYMAYVNSKSCINKIRKFTNKWVYNNKNPNAYLLEYDEFMKDPYLHLSAIIQEIDGTVNKERLEKVIKDLNINKKFFIEKSNLYIENFNETYNLKNTNVGKIGFINR